MHGKCIKGLALPLSCPIESIIHPSIERFTDSERKTDVRYQRSTSFVNPPTLKAPLTFCKLMLPRHGKAQLVVLDPELQPPVKAPFAHEQLALQNKITC